VNLILENLLDRVTSRWRVANPVVPASQTTEVRPEGDDLEKDLPLGFDNGAWGYYVRMMKLVRSRRELYATYDEMDEELPEFSSAMNIYADNATRGDSDGSVRLTLKSEDARVQKILTDTRDLLRLEDKLWPLARDLAKYGERAVENIVHEDTFDIIRLKPLPTSHIIERYDEYGRPMDPPFAQLDDKGEQVATFEDWQVIYFANKKSLSDTFGTSLARAAIRAWQQLRMMEDAVVIARLTRAHNRLAYLVDTGSLTPQEAQKHLQKVKAHLSKRRTIDPKTGKMDTSYNPMQVEADVFVATNKESKADVKVLQGDLTVGNLADLEYFQQKIFTALQVPKPYLAHEKDTRTKSVVTAQDIQFARSVRRIQQVMAEGLRKLFDFALLLKGINPRKVQYTIGFPVISIVDDLRVWQTEQLKMLVAQMMKQNFWPSDEWIFIHLLGYDSDEAKLVLRDQKKPDEFNGLYQAPKVGATANNAKTGETESVEFAARLAALDEGQREQVAEAIETLRLITDWKLAA